MKAFKFILALTLGLTTVSCDKDFVLTPEQNDELEVRGAQDKVTGDVEIIWRGQGGNPETENERQAFVSLVAFAPFGNKVPKGNFTFEVMKDNLLERRIEAQVFAAAVHPEDGKAWVLAEVILDSRACSDHGGSGGGHDEGGEGCDHDDGEGGCDHEDGESCDHTDDGGCSHDDGGDGHDAGCEGSDSGHGGGVQITGKQCRIGQIVAVKVHDQATPATEGDGITWKWFESDDPNLPDIGMPDSWPHLCRKTILSGNLVVH